MRHALEENLFTTSRVAVVANHLQLNILNYGKLHVILAPELFCGRFCHRIAAKGAMMKHIPNILSCFRLALVGVFIYLFTREEYLWCMITYLTAFCTDVLDGYLARRNNWITNIGKVLDPLADKLMLIAVLCCFYLIDLIPLYLLAIMILKDLIMIIAGAVLFSKHVVVFADWFGKIATGLFALAIVLSFVHLIWDALNIHIYVYNIALVAAIVSFFHYGIKTVTHKEQDNAE